MNIFFTIRWQHVVTAVIVIALVSTPFGMKAETATTTPQMEPASLPGTTTPNVTETETESASQDTDLESSGTTTPSTTPEIANEATSSVDSINEDPAETGTSTETVIDTGDASTETESANNLNSTEVTATSTGSSTTTIDTESKTTIENTGTTSAYTGNNLATTTGTASIVTGDAMAVHSFVNLVNTTVVNSKGFIQLLNLLFGTDNLDFRESDFSAFFTEGSGTTSNPASVNCSLDGCDDPNTNYSVTNSNTATVTNSYVVRANSGDNTASGDEASIDTGNAYAFLNGINLVNSTFVDSNYLLISVNKIGNYLGDVILPGADFFKKFLTSVPAISGNDSAVTVENDVTIENNVNVVADTGQNTASTSETANVLTGDSCALAEVTNTANQTQIGGNMVNILVRVSGNWSGEIFGLPEGLSWEQTDQGVRIYTEPDLLLATSSTAQTQASTSIKNQAYINNDINVTALTGDNMVKGDNGTIQTGDACSVASIHNVANTSVVGSNWMSAFFNILGNFSGNISFGQPDLWIGGVANLTEEYVRPGSHLSYTYTIFNNGDAVANDIILTQDTSRYIEDIRTEDMQVVASTTPQEWQIETLDPGNSLEVTFDAKVVDNLPYGVTPINLIASVRGHEPDGNDTDNQETVSILGYHKSPTSRDGSKNRQSRDSDPPELKLEKWVGSSTKSTLITKPLSELSTSTPVRYTVVITNEGGPAYNATLYDTLSDVNETVINEQVWFLGTINSGETIEVSYTVNLGSGVTDGQYLNTAKLEAYEEEINSSTDEEDLRISTSSALIEVSRTPLTIFNVEVDATGEYSDSYVAEIRWETNLPSISRVVYGPVGTWSSPSSTDQNFGYLNSTASSSASTTHFISVKSLLPDTTYEFRAVSYLDTKQTISDEGLFTVPTIEPELPASKPISNTTVDSTPATKETAPTTSTSTTGAVAGINTEVTPDLPTILPQLLTSVAYAQTTDSGHLTNQKYIYELLTLILIITLTMIWALSKRYRFNTVSKRHH